MVSDDATLTTSGLFASYGATVVFETFAHVYATGSNFSYGKTLFGGSFVADGLVSADFEGPTTIANADFTGKGAIVIGYQNKEDAASLTDKASVHVLGSSAVTNSFTLIADGALVLEGSATWIRAVDRLTSEGIGCLRHWRVPPHSNAALFPCRFRRRGRRCRA